MILTHGANILKRGGDFVEIGGRKYPDLAYAKGSLSDGPNY